MLQIYAGIMINIYTIVPCSSDISLASTFCTRYICKARNKIILQPQISIVHNWNILIEILWRHWCVIHLDIKNIAVATCHCIDTRKGYKIFYLMCSYTHSLYWNVSLVPKEWSDGTVSLGWHKFVENELCYVFWFYKIIHMRLVILKCY